MKKNKRGHVTSVRRHGSLLFLDLIEANSLLVTKCVTKEKNFVRLLGRLNRGAWLNILVTEEEGRENWKILKVIECRDNRTLLDPLAAFEWKSQTKNKFRWIYFRNPKARELMFFRQRMLQIFRNKLIDKDFLEVQTPILTSPVEEGARSYLVLSRLHKDSFYALAQSPQIYKQILTYGGINYFQIAPVFRDEDGRRDRTNGEFYQLDIEMLTTEIEELLELSLFLIKTVLKEFKISYSYKGVITYEESIRKYGNDKPEALDLEDVEAFKGESKQSLTILAILDFPMFKERNGSFHYMNNPFGKAVWTEERDLTKIESKQFDIVISGIEVLSGGLRSIKEEDLLKNFTTIGQEESFVKEKYYSLFTAFKSGIGQHGGFALGIERMLKIIYKALTGLDLPVNEMLAFPLDDQKREPMSKAPSKLENWHE